MLEKESHHGLSMVNKSEAIEISVDGNLVLLCAYCELLTFVTVEIEPRFFHTVDDVFSAVFCDELTLTELLYLKGVFCCMLSNKMAIYADGLTMPRSQ
tara:strand:- start:750 stop:1043 length:294 start_codon:yes stop_codon:yes gene_type:complete